MVGPLALIHVVGVFRETGEIDYAKVRAAGRPRIRRGFSDVIKTRPDVHPGEEGVLLHDLPGLLVSRSPGSTAIVVRRTTEILIAILEWLVVANRPSSDLIRRHVIAAPRLTGRGCL